ncbi:hypothetical protein C5S53_09995 [Methanophagales archaeon]|jgi:hypothetical protein|nr:hypothetical protein C5S53_09995 [Methanophagales archaeon]
MATKLATGISKGEDSEKVAKEAVSQAKAKFNWSRGSSVAFTIPLR